MCLLSRVVDVFTVFDVCLSGIVDVVVFGLCLYSEL